MAYSLLNQGDTTGINELVLIDVLKDKAIGEAMDLAHGLPCSSSHLKVKAGDYLECNDADITRQVVASGFNGIFLVASNPVDLMTKVVQEVSNFPTNKVIGSGTALDTARLRYLIGKYLNISNKNVHAYIMGEHGDSSFVPWDHAYVGCKKIKDIMKDAKRDLADLDKIYVDVRDAAYEIIEKKKATYYGIGLGLAKIVKSILNDTNEILTVSAYLNGEYGHNDIYIGVPAVINSNGARELLTLELNESDQKHFDDSCKILTENMNTIRESLND